jgi:hypothetical protein
VKSFLGLLTNTISLVSTRQKLFRGSEHQFVSHFSYRFDSLPTFLKPTCQSIHQLQAAIRVDLALEMSISEIGVLSNMLKVVDRYSSKLSAPDEEAVVLEGNHFTILKPSEESEDKLQVLSEKIESLSKAAFISESHCICYAPKRDLVTLF